MRKKTPHVSPLKRIPDYRTRRLSQHHPIYNFSYQNVYNRDLNAYNHFQYTKKHQQKQKQKRKQFFYYFSDHSALLSKIILRIQLIQKGNKRRAKKNFGTIRNI